MTWLDKKQVIFLRTKSYKGVLRLEYLALFNGILPALLIISFLKIPVRSYLD